MKKWVYTVRLANNETGEVLEWEFGMGRIAESVFNAIRNSFFMMDVSGWELRLYDGDGEERLYDNGGAV